MRILIQALWGARAGYLLSVVDQIGLSAFSFLVSLVAIRLLDRSDLGLYSVWGSACVFAMGLQGALIVVPLTIHVPAATEEERPLLLHGVRLVNGAFSAATIGAVTTVILVLDASWIPQPAATRALVCVVIAAALFHEFPRQAAFGAGRVSAVIVMDGAFLAVAATTLGIGILAPPKPQAGGLLFIFLGSQALGAGAAGLVGRHLMRTNSSATGVQGMRAYRRVIPEVRWAAIGSFGSILQDRTYIMLVTALAGIDKVGEVWAGGVVLRTSAVLATAWVRVARPKMARLAASHDVRGLEQVMWTGAAVLLAQHLLLCGGVVLLWRWIEPLLFHGRHPDVYEVTLFWMATTTIGQFRSALSLTLQATKDFRFLALATGIAAAVTMPATVAAILLIGWKAAILGLGAGEAANSVATLLRWRRIRVRLRAGRNPNLNRDEAAPVRVAVQ